MTGTSDPWGPPPGDVVLTFRVAGVPQPQGSKVPAVTRDGRPYLREDVGHRMRAWRQALHVTMVTLAQREVRCPLTGPVEVALLFGVKAPQNLPKDRLGWPAARPDLDKLARAVNDSLTSSGVLKDDALICSQPLRKVYPDRSGPLRSVGVLVRVSLLQESEPQLALDEALR